MPSSRPACPSRGFSRSIDEHGASAIRSRAFLRARRDGAVAEILSLSLMQGCAPLVVVSQLLCPTGGTRRLMDHKTLELSVLLMLASTTGIFAWAVDRPLFIPLFVAEATYLAA